MNATIAAQPTGVYSLISSHSVSDQGNWLPEIFHPLMKLAETRRSRSFRVIDELGEAHLEGLEPGWDGYGAQPVSEEVWRTR
jgi:hypothetical protein